jgi:phage gpG-like protein
VTAKITVIWGEMEFFRVRKLLGDMRPVFSAIGMELIKQVGQNFETEGIWAKWAPMKESTKFSRRQGGSSKLLAATGKLRASFRMEAQKNFVRVGSPLMVARLHHEGRRGPWTIKPKNAKALAFPWAGGTALGKGGSAKLGSYSYHKRSKAFLSNTPMAVVMKVIHPGYPARLLLPPPEVAQRIAVQVSEMMIDMARGA